MENLKITCNRCKSNTIAADPPIDTAGMRADSPELAEMSYGLAQRNGWRIKKLAQGQRAAYCPACAEALENGAELVPFVEMDRPCPKCGASGETRFYCSPDVATPTKSALCHGVTVEHLHSICKTCRFERAMRCKDSKHGPAFIASPYAVGGQFSGNGAACLSNVLVVTPTVSAPPTPSLVAPEPTPGDRLTALKHAAEFADKLLLDGLTAAPNNYIDQWEAEDAHVAKTHAALLEQPRKGAWTFDWLMSHGFVEIPPETLDKRYRYFRRAIDPNDHTSWHVLFPNTKAVTFVQADVTEAKRQADAEYTRIVSAGETSETGARARQIAWDTFWRDYMERRVKGWVPVEPTAPVVPPKPVEAEKPMPTYEATLLALEAQSAIASRDTATVNKFLLARGWKRLDADGLWTSPDGIKQPTDFAMRLEYRRCMAAVGVKVE